MLLKFAGSKVATYRSGACCLIRRTAGNGETVYAEAH